MTITKGIGLIRQFVLKHIMKGSKKEGIMTIPKASNESVDLSVEQIGRTLRAMGVDVNKLASEKELMKHLNYHQSLMKQRTRGK